jgi:Uma2 family endonuclease
MGDFEGDTPEAMAGAKPAHNAIRENLSIFIGGYFKKNKGCRSYSSDQRVRVDENGLFTYPDLVVVCGKPEFTNDSLINPVLIVEVLSKSTADYDRSGKFELYRGIASFREYLLVDSQRVYVELHRKNDEGLWILAAELRSLNDSVTLQTIGLNISLQDIYSDTEDLPNVMFEIR